MEQAFASSVTKSLLAWYDRHRRILPWRAPPGTKSDAYGVWLSEIMLQQTTVRVVQPYFEKFVRQWPSVESLAAASLEDVLRAWAGLGYYARARNLHRCAREVAARGGRFPETATELQRLPGIGSYTAAAIAAIAFDERVAAVDGNAERVLARLFALAEPLPKAKAQIRPLALSLVPDARSGDFAQAMMDLGALVCTPRDPDCRSCPFAGPCLARARGIAALLPLKEPRAPKPLRRGTAFWIEHDGRTVLLRRRPETGLLGGMMEIPSTRWLQQASEPLAEAPLAAKWHETGRQIEHTFTHFHLVLDIWRTQSSPAAINSEPYRWVSFDRLAEEALPSVMRKIAAAMIGPDAFKPAGRR